jgi:hypothetical protein
MSQLTPINEFVSQTKRYSAVDGIVSQMKGNPTFNQLNDPRVEQAFRQALANHSGEVNTTTVTNLYIYAAGAVATGVYGGNVSSPPANNNPPNNPPPRNPDPAHIRPDPRPGNQASDIRLPALDANQMRIAKERGWSHARAAYMNKLITQETYQKVEPQGKLVEGL